jgi:hypothetical protein
VHVSVGCLYFLEELVAVPGDPRVGSRDERFEQGISEVRRIDQDEGVRVLGIARSAHRERPRGKVVTEEIRGGGLPADPVSWDLELPGDHMHQVRKERRTL